MSYKDLLVHVDASRHIETRLALAVALARRFAAQLTGIYVMPPVTLSPFLADQFPPERLQEADAQIAQRRDVAKALFEASTAGLVPKAEWFEGEGDATELVMREARYADLAILGQADPDERAPAVSADFPERVALGSGRPVLVIPYAGRFATVGERVLV
ncbi:MAG: universal stress protein, partial [Alphaproteobacteria bacterium]